MTHPSQSEKERPPVICSCCGKPAPEVYVMGVWIVACDRCGT